MKTGGILHPELSQWVASIGHTDYIVLADKGFPIPKQIDRINLGIADDIPTVLDVLEILSTEMKIDRMIITEEMQSLSPTRVETLKERFPNIKLDSVNHKDFKEMTGSAYGAVKTADVCPYANVIVVSG